MMPLHVTHSSKEKQQTCQGKEKETNLCYITEATKNLAAKTMYHTWSLEEVNKPLVSHTRIIMHAHKLLPVRTGSSRVGIHSLFLDYLDVTLILYVEGTPGHRCIHH